MKKFIQQIVFLLAIVLVVPTFADDWRPLVQGDVRNNQSFDVMSVTESSEAVEQIKISTRNSGIYVLRIIVEYASGKSDELELSNKIIRSGTESQVLDLPSGKQVIKKVQFYFRAPSDALGQSIVTVWGRNRD